MGSNVTRRHFMASTSDIALAAATSGAATPPKAPCVCVFSKHLQFLDYKALAKTCKQVGLDGVDLTVRAKGHVLPDNVAVDLPRAVDAIRGQGLEVPMITTRLNRGDDPDARPIFEAASKLGIRYARIGGHKYKEDEAILPQLDQFADDLASLAKVAEEYGMNLGYHNHSGLHNVGAAIWDLRYVYERVGSLALGSNLDVGHLAVEGAYGAWKVNARMIAPYVKMMAVKDFVWNKDRPQWTPLGEGIVRTPDILAIVRKAGFAGPISLHFEYDIPSDDAMIEEIRAAVTTLRRALKRGGYV